jgi:hypothetical protein
MYVVVVSVVAAVAVSVMTQLVHVLVLMALPEHKV